MKLSEFIDLVSKLVFPLRTELKKDNDYLRSQVAYHQRRADVLEAKLISLIDRPAEVKPRISPPKPNFPQTSWDSYKLKQKETNDRSEAEPQSDAPAVA